MDDFWTMTGPLYQPLRWVHILTGSVAFFAAPVALAIAKGNTAHRRAGWAYVGAMGFAAVSALILAIIHPNPFLLLLAVFAFYLSLTGVRMLRLKYKDAERRAPALLDHVISGVMVLASLGLIGLAANGFLRGNSFAVVYLVFGLISLLLVIGEFRARKAAETDRKKWLSLHIQRMMGAYISTVTAFAAVNFGKWFPEMSLIVIWLGPTVIGTGLIVYYINRFVKSKTGVIHVRQ
ncbi:MAG: hypothetical protein H8F28_00440 [Fibrella sp.]|nr:hypothetical protein [Armatimonadota bacterium]